MMDQFIEQLVTIKTGKKVSILKVSVWTVCAFMSLGLIGFSFLRPNLAIILLLLAAGVMFVAYYLCTQLNIEYEYSLTNGEFDIDRIINQSKRQHLATVNCSEILDIESYNPKIHKTDKANNKNVYIGCNASDENALALKIKHSRYGYYTLVITPNEELRNGIKSYLPFSLKNKI